MFSKCKSKNYLVFPLALILALLLPAVASAITQDEEIKIGQQEVTKLRTTGFVQEPALSFVGEKLKEQATRKDLPWQFWVLNEDKDLNAFALPGGFVFITRPYYEILNGDELAFVIGHEMTHVEKHHFESRLQRAKQAQIYNILAAIILNTTKAGGGWGAATDLGVTAFYTSYSRKQEKEADVGGYALAKAAGFDARSAVSALDKLKDKFKSDPVYKNIYATHPVVSNREERLSELAKNDPPTPSKYPAFKTANPNWKKPPPTRDELKKRPGLAIRVVGEDGLLWERKWRNDFRQLLAEQIEQAGTFAVRGEDRADERQQPSLGELRKSEKADWLMLVTVRQMTADNEGQPDKSGQKILATVNLTAQMIDTATGKDYPAESYQESLRGAQLLPTDGAHLYEDMVATAAAKKVAGKIALKAASFLTNPQSKQAAAKPLRLTSPAHSAIVSFGDKFMSAPPNIILATDCGSTTTKAILIECKDGSWRLVARGEAPTTVEAPFDDVTVGVLNAIGELEELTGRHFLENGKILLPSKENSGADLYLSTSSAGGGLQMLVTGVVKAMTAESAQRAALGAGAIVVEVLAVDDGRAEYERIERIRYLRPDMVLMSGGTEGGTTSHLLDMAETLRAASPRPRLGQDFRLPVIYAGNSAARAGVNEILDNTVALTMVDNLRPVLERENLLPAREEIHRLFLEHVMAQAPGYDKLLRWTSAPILPTPMAVGEMVQAAARAHNASVVAVDIGGATTDVFSVFDNTFNRTVSANLGLSYSVSNVLAEAGTANILRWLPFDLPEDELRNRLRNKMIRPTTIPQTLEDLYLEQGVAREALRLAFAHHEMLASGLKGVQQQRTIADVFAQGRTNESLVDLMALNLIIGSGGVLSHAPMREQAALMMIDAFQPQGITRLAVDSIFMMPQLGVLASVQPEAAQEVFERDCLIWLGTVAAAVGTGRAGENVMSYQLRREDGTEQSGQLAFGELRRLPLGINETATLRLEPARKFDLGAGPGRTLETKVNGGVVGIILDARGRPLQLPANNNERKASLGSWMKELGFPTVPTL